MFHASEGMFHTKFLCERYARRHCHQLHLHLQKLHKLNLKKWLLYKSNYLKSKLS